MKNLILIAFVLIISSNSFAQKKKNLSKSEKSGIILAKTDNYSAQIIIDNFLLFKAVKGIKTDTFIVKKIDIKNLPTDAKITIFNAKATPLVMLNWIEKQTNTTDLKNEEIINTNTEIYDFASKNKVFANIQKNTKSTEKNFLDKKKTVSETQTRNRNEGFAITINPDGDLILKTKTQENKKTFDAVAKKFIDKR